MTTILVKERREILIITIICIIENILLNRSIQFLTTMRIPLLVGSIGLVVEQRRRANHPINDRQIFFNKRQVMNIRTNTN